MVYCVFILVVILFFYGLSDPSLTFEQQCRGITKDDLTETRSCGNVACPKYEWETGEWTACIVQHAGTKCCWKGGGGMREGDERETEREREREREGRGWRERGRV